LDNIPEPARRGHEHCVDVCFAEQRCGGGDCWRDADFGGLAELAFMTGGGVVFDILRKCWPPKAVEEGSEGRVVPFVT